MYILNLVILLFIIIYLYTIITVFLKKRNKLIYHLITILIYIWLLNTVLITLNDLYYFYLIYKLINISIYILLILFSNSNLNFKSVLIYYFLGFTSSILFILGLYNLSFNDISIFLITISILLKLGIYPFNQILSTIYKDSSFGSFLVLSYIINFQYIYILYIFLKGNNLHLLSYFRYIIFIILIVTLLISGYYFNKQYELKGFTAYSSVVNVPIITLSLILDLNIINMQIINMISNYILWYIVLYLSNFFFLNTYAINLEVFRSEKKWLQTRLYFSSLSALLNSYTKEKNIVAVMICIVGAFPPTILFILKFHLFYLFSLCNNLLFLTLIMTLLNTIIVYCYLRVITRIFNIITY